MKEEGRRKKEEKDQGAGGFISSFILHPSYLLPDGFGCNCSFDLPENRV
jgi:hypothetical protein